jgi:parallel beta-helix repeat protein
MTIGTNTARVSANCDGVSKIFPVAIQAYLGSDFLVLLTNNASGLSTLLTLNADYSMATGSTDAPPKWTLTTLAAAAYAAGNTLQVILNTAEVQQTQYVQGQQFPSLAVQTNVDRLTQMAIRLSDQMSRAIVAPDGDVSPVMALPAQGLRKSTNLGFDASGNLALNLQLLAGTISTATLAPFLGLSQTPAEAAVPVVPVNLQYAPGNVNRYATNTTPGTTDMTAAVQAAINQSGQTGGAAAYVPPGTYLCSSTLTLVSNGTLYGDGAKSILQFSNNNTSNISGAALTDATVRNLKITVTGNGNQSYVGAVNLNTGCTNCIVDSLDISGNSGCGVLLQDAISCRISNNYFHNFNVVNANADVGDIYLGVDVGTGCRYNVITGNQCFGGAWHGIMMLTAVAAPGTTHNMFNVVSNNRIGQHLAYGIADYSGNANSDLYNQIIGNYIENIQGPASVLGGSAGAGIYLSACGGDVVANNTIRNCCVQTTNQTLTPAGIGVGALGNSATQAPIVISGNLITDMTQYHGIEVAASPAPVQVTGNTIRMPVSNSTGNAIFVNQCSNCNVTGNNIGNLSANAGILFSATSAVANNSFIANTIATGNVGIQTNGVGPYNKTVITDNNIVGSTASAALNLNNLAQAVISNNVLGCTGQAVTLTACTQVRMTGNSIVCGGTFAIATSGTCTDTFIDESNYLSGASNTYMNAVNNAGTGAIFVQYASAVAAAGAHAVGDWIKQSIPVVGNPKGWRCTVAATPGTFTSEGNL